MSPRFHRRLTAWAVLCLLAAVVLTGYCLLDTAFSGRSVPGLVPLPYATADAVHYELDGFRYLYQGKLLTGPHLSYPLVLAALVLNLGALWLARAWGGRVRVMQRVNVWALVLTLGVGWPVLLVAQKAHNGFLAQGNRASISASPLVLHAQSCVKTSAEGVCLATQKLGFPNPTAWGLAGLFLTGLAGLFGGRRDEKHADLHVLNSG